MKKLVTILITAAMILTMAVPAFADDAGTVATVKPAKVQELKVLKNGYKSLKVTWKAVDGAEKYQVYRSKTGKTGSFALKKTTTATSYANIGITCGKTYYYKVRAVNSKGKGAFSVVKSNKVQPATAKITSVPLGGKDSAPYDHTPKPTWNKVAGATGYQLYRTIEGKNNWKRIATTKRTYYLDNFDAGFRSWKNYEYKVRAYRTVNGKKVYGYFSKADKYVPDWNMEELMPELIAYGESIKRQRLQYNPITEENEAYTGPEGSTYNLQHIIGFIENPSTETGWEYVNWGDTAATKNPTYEANTPENSSWTALFPEKIGHYWKKSTVLKETKSMVKFAIKSQMEANPLTWVPAGLGTMGAGWTGEDTFTIYTRKSTGGYENGYDFWVMH